MKRSNRSIVILLFLWGLLTYPLYASYGGGTGEPNDPYLIATGVHMNAIGLNSSDWDKHFRLVDDIDLSAYTGLQFNLIGKNFEYGDPVNQPFTGVFDGNGFTISNFTHGSSDVNCAAIFKYVDSNEAEIKNVGLLNANVNVSNGHCIGSLVGIVESGTISNCYLRGGDITGWDSTGGLIGAAVGNQVSIEYCYSICDVYSWKDNAGGLIGTFSGAAVFRCYTLGTAGGTDFVGGLIGGVGSDGGMIRECYTAGIVDAFDQCGGLIGRIRATDQDCYIWDCYSICNVKEGETPYGNAGGLVGVSVLGRAEVRNCYSAGAVTGPGNYVAGFSATLVGFGGDVIDCFWDTQASGQSVGDYDPEPDWTLTGKTTAEMMDPNTFLDAGWDFVDETLNGPNDIWKMNEYGGNYPLLAWQEPVSYYVDASSGNNNNTGLFEGAAFATIQKGVDAARGGNIVCVMPGTYQEDIYFTGYPMIVTGSNPLDPNVVAETILEGYALFYGNENAGCEFKGFKLTLPPGEFEGPIDGWGTQARMSHCIIRDLVVCGSPLIYDFDGSISNCLIAGNDDTGGCGSPYAVMYECDAVVRNCTIVDNDMPAISVWTNEEMTVENCIIYNNETPQVEVVSSALLDISYCNLQGGLAGISGSGTINWGLGNIETDPCFVNPGSDYHLKSEGWRWNESTGQWVHDGVSSRCVDAGHPGVQLCGELLSVPGDPNNNYGVNLRINMGFYGGTLEASIAPNDWVFLSDLTNDGIVDFEDLEGLAVDWLENSENRPGDLNRDISVDFLDFSALAADWFATTEWYE